MQRKKGGSLWWLFLFGLGAMGAGGEPPEAPGNGPEPGPKPEPPKCDPGFHPEWNEAGGFWVCAEDIVIPGAVVQCPPGQHRDAATGECVPDAEIVIPGVVQCPPGQHRDATTGECVADIVIPGVVVVDDPGLDDPKIVNPYATPATWRQVRAGESEFGVMQEFVPSCLYLAAKEVLKLEHAAALAWASQRNTAQNRIAALRFISCVPQNDAYYGTFAFTPCGFTGQQSGCTFPGAQGRGIRFIKQHGNTEARARGGKPLRRTVRIGKVGDSPSGWSALPASEREYPFLWMGKPDYATLANSDGKVWVASTDNWSDGVSKFQPPPAFRALGFEDLSASNRSTWGCAPNEVEV